MEKSDIGVIGPTVMGEDLALNLESRGYSVSVNNQAGMPTPPDFLPTKLLPGKYAHKKTFVKPINKTL